LELTETQAGNHNTSKIVFHPFCGVGQGCATFSDCRSHWKCKAHCRPV